MPYTEDEQRDILDRAQQVGELVGHPGWVILRQEYEKHAQAKRELILAGNCKTMEEYVASAGYLHGGEAIFAIPGLLETRAAEARRQGATT